MDTFDVGTAIIAVRTAAPRAFSVPVVREIASWQLLGAAYRT